MDGLSSHLATIAVREQTWVRTQLPLNPVAISVAGFFDSYRYVVLKHKKAPRQLAGALGGLVHERGVGTSIGYYTKQNTQPDKKFQTFFTLPLRRATKARGVRATPARWSLSPSPARMVL